MHLLQTYHLHRNGGHLCPNKLLDKLFVISVIISILWQLQVSTSDDLKPPSSLLCARILCEVVLVN